MALAYWVEKGENVFVGKTANGKVLEPWATLTKGKWRGAATIVALYIADIGLMVTKAVPSARVTIGT